MGDSYRKRGGYISSDEEMVIPVAPDGSAPGALTDYHYPRLRIHATGAGPNEIDEISLDGVHLHATRISLVIDGQDLTTATIELYVRPDIDVAADIS